ncbi:MAG: phage major tail tube protein [Candidatus Binataceae bacterium]
MNLQINRLTNANIYLNGVDLLGRAEEVDLPQPKGVMIEHKGLGMFSKAEFPAGLDKMEMKIKWSSLYPEVMGAAFNLFAVQSLMVRADVMSFNAQGLAAELPAVALVNGIFSEMPGLSIRKQENADVPSSVAVYYYQLSFAGIPQVEIDVMANVYKVNGIDQLAAFRMNQGG